MADEAGTTSVFTDDSGMRERLITWTVRSVIGLIVTAGLALGFSLATGVPLPTPLGPLHLPGSSAEHPSTGSVDGAGRQVPTAPLTISPSATATSNPHGSDPAASATKGPGTTLPGSSTSGATSTPSIPAPSATKAPGAKANHGVASTKAPRATPTHAPGGPAPTPPGRAK